MSQSKISKYSIAEISDMVKQTESLSDVLSLMGYKQVNSKNILLQLQKICDENNIPYSYVHSPFKVCSLCNKRKPIDEYYKMNGRYMSFCKECQKEKERIKYAQKQEEFIVYKKTLRCKKCGESRFYLLDFHHRNPEEKDYAISDNSRASLASLEIELEKCDVLCSNCHREWHYLSSHNQIDYETWLNADVGELV